MGVECVAVPALYIEVIYNVKKENEKLVDNYMDDNDDPEKHDTITLEELAKREGIEL